ncbi:cation-transporting P-type ATPase [Nocardioides sp. zg-ZUI104]|uniref:cation-translocating P-type ATPase n=1 Tax=Nocardioides faecalis TaxID=2803858 RepID=UPI001BCC01FB|nr:cation-transporting P-type ATPase [Nocardioides faecalis]MBS4752529.1 cation-transporting P-type ATPase [Nocardioides faecalis]
MRTDPPQVRGLTEQQVAQRREQYGANTLPEPRRQAPWLDLLRQMTHLLAVLLWVAAVLAAVAGMPELAIAIAVIVVLNGVFAFWQEHRADRSAQQLRALLPARTRVVRSGEEVVVDASDLVVGDLVRVEAGDRVGADMVLVETDNVTVDESMLTGESAAVAHDVGDKILTGTYLVEGEGWATVEAVGTATAFAGISRLSESAHRPQSPFHQQLNKVVRVVAVVAFSVGAALGVGGYLLGLGATEAFLFGVGVSVALVPEGLLPTVTLSLARGAQRMAAEDALVRRLDAVETLGATTFICTDKTGTLTQNRMNVVAVETPGGRHDVAGDGYAPRADISGDGPPDELRAAALAGLRCVTGRVVEKEGGWIAEGDPLEAAIHALALRAEVPVAEPDARRAYTAERMISSALADGQVSVLGAPEAVMARCQAVPASLSAALDEMTGAGLRVLAVARRTWDGEASDAMEEDLELLGLLGLQDPPREDVADAVRSCRDAGIRTAMITGDHPATGQAIAREIGLLRDGGVVVEGRELPADDAVLAELLDTPHGAVVARASPADKLRIAKALQRRGHVVAMTGDGVNDAPALRAADVGVAMGLGGSDVARSASDLVLLDDHFATIVTAIELGRATTKNVRRFLTFHLTDNVAELAPFAAWALTGGTFPLALSVLQVLALDIGTDMLPALALGAEPPRSDVMKGRRRRVLVDRALAVRAFLVLGGTEATLALGAFAAVLWADGWRWGTTPGAQSLALASGTAFATIACMQVANSFACRSTRLPVWRLDLTSNRLLLVAVAVELVLLLVFVGFPPVADLLGGAFPEPSGWAMAVAASVVLVLVDGLVKVGWGNGRSRGARLP